VHKTIGFRDPEFKGLGIRVKQQKLQKTEYRSIEPYTTKDGSEIRELMHPALYGNGNQSLAEATLPADAETALHKHIITEELYHILQGTGEMVIGEDVFTVKPGDTVNIPPGTIHKIKNTGTDELKIMCCCTPPYTHEDTLLAE